MQQNLNKSTLSFIADLQKNNDRDWFNNNKNRYEEARKDHVGFLNDLLPIAATIDSVSAGQQGKDLVYRIYRDVRFSKNKNPYKDHFGAYLAEGGRKSVNPGYYLHISPNNQSFIASGLWHPEAVFLKAVRQEIDYSLDEFESIILNPEFSDFYGEITGEQLKTNPKGYTADNPAIKYLRFKSWNAVHMLSDAVVTSNKLQEQCLKGIQLAKPLTDFFMRPLREISNPASN